MRDSEKIQACRLRKRKAKPSLVRSERERAWEQLRGCLKDVFAEFGGGEAYLRAERSSFKSLKRRK